MSLTRPFLEIVDGPGKGRRIMLRDGQDRYVGRTTQADDSCPENVTMSSVHFKVRWSGGKCELKDLNSANGTWRNGKKVTESLLGPGDEFKAGKSTFRVVVADDSGGLTTTQPPEYEAKSDTHVEHSHAPHAAPPQMAAPEAPLGTGLAIARAEALPDTAQISDASKTMLVDDMSVPQFIELLASREQYLDALRVIAHAAEKRTAVAWSCRCVRSALSDDLSPLDEDALKAAEAWAAEPDEKRRRVAQAAAEALEGKTAASWTAMAAFWSSGSMGPPTAPVVPPAPHLTAHAAAGAVMLAAVAKQPEKAPEKYIEFLRIANEMINEQTRA